MTSFPQTELRGTRGRCGSRTRTCAAARQRGRAGGARQHPHRPRSACRSCATCWFPRTSTRSATRSCIARRSRSMIAARRSTPSPCATSSSAGPGSAGPAVWTTSPSSRLVVPSSASVKHYADIVIAHALRRRLIEAGGKVSRLGFDNTTPVAEAIDLGRAGSLQDRPGEPRLGDAQHRAGGARVVGHPREPHREQAAGHRRADELLQARHAHPGPAAR